MSSFTEQIKGNLADVRGRVSRAALKSGRQPDEIQIIAVTKTIDIPRINTAIEEGIINLGENRVQELCEKYDNINGVCNWHLIGHLQTNKVKYIIDKVKMVHSLDRLDLAQELQSKAEKVGRTIDVLVQVNVSGEMSKYGISPQNTKEFINSLRRFKNINVKGLMTIAPFTDRPESTRPVFKGLREIFIDMAGEKFDNISMEFLSMGMSNDFEIAIEEGANMVRIGTALFGSR